MSSYKCPHCEYYMWEGKEFYECDIQDKVSKLEQENTELRSTLQEIKAIAKGVRSYLEVPAPRDVIYEMDRILNLITKAEEE